MNNLAAFFGIQVLSGEFCTLCLQDDHVENPKQLPKQTMYYVALVADNWEAEFNAKVNDDVYVNIGKCTSIVTLTHVLECLLKLIFHSSVCINIMIMFSTWSFAFFCINKPLTLFWFYK